jgi:hypothetical protein
MPTKPHRDVRGRKNWVSRVGHSIAVCIVVEVGETPSPSARSTEEFSHHEKRHFILSNSTYGISLTAMRAECLGSEASHVVVRHEHPNHDALSHALLT